MRLFLTLFAVVVSGVMLTGCGEQGSAGRTGEGTTASDTGTAEMGQAAVGDGEQVPEGMAPLPLELPRPQFKETPKNVPPGVKVEKASSGPRKAFLAPKGVVNLARGAKVTASDSEPLIGSLELINDGNKEADEGNWVVLWSGPQWVQLDLGLEHELWAIVVWRYHGQARVYHDVIVQKADDPDFIEGVETLFNNDHDNSSGMGVGDELGYWETFRGKLHDVKGVTARYLRFYSNGNTSDEFNHYTEIEVWGLPKQ